MDFKKILANFDAVENNTSTNAVEKKKSAGSMLAILESFNRVENETVEEAAEEEVVAEGDDFMVTDPEGAWAAISARKEELVDMGMEPEEAQDQAAEEIGVDPEDLEAWLMQNMGENLEEAIMVSAEGDEAAQLLSILQLAGMSAPAPAMPAPAMGPMEPEMGPEMEMQDEYSNSPDEVEQDVDAVIASGDDLHREKSQYAAATRGDNPMKAFEGKFKSILDELLAEEEK